MRKRIIKMFAILSLLTAMITASVSVSALALVITPPSPLPETPNKTKILNAYKDYLSKKTIYVLPKGSKYSSVIKNGTYKGSKQSNVKFGLAYIDNNNEPELVLEAYETVNGTQARIGAAVFSFIGGKVKRIFWASDFCNFYGSGYYPKKSIFTYHQSTQGSISYDTVCRMTGTTVKKNLFEIVNKLGLYDPKTGKNKVIKQYNKPSGKNGWKQISKNEYKKSLKKYVGNTSFVKFDLKKNTKGNRQYFLLN